MNFSEQLNNYISILNCSLKELANISNLSSSVISRYRSGERVPNKESEQLKKLSKGISGLATKNNLPNMTEEIILSNFITTLNDSNIDFEQIRKNFNEIISVLDINMTKMSKALNFDASYLSRIRTGNRKPSDPEVFTNAVCNFIVQRYINYSEKKAISDLIGCKYEDIENNSNYLLKLTKWFCSTNKETHNYIGDFLKKLDEFNLDKYIRLIHFDDLKVPTVPFHFPTAKHYYGIEEMKKGELDFFKATVLSKSNEPVFMCSDMPMEDMAEDVEFGKKWMFAIAMTLKRGLHLNIIHNIDRPFSEMMLGLESWIPIYMTGQISPYYLKGLQTSVYCHFNYVSGSVALTGECINGFHKKGKYFLTNNKEDVAYVKEKATCLLNKAQPLMEIYRKDSSNVYNAFVTGDSHTSGKRHNILSSLPIYTMPEEMLMKILERYSTSNTDKKRILEFVSRQKEITENILKNSSNTDEILELSKEEFEKYPMCLSLSGCFFEKKLCYTYDEYLEHLKLTKEFSNNNKNYTLKLNNQIAFRNIQISIHDGKWVMISKDNDPTIHFIIRHSKLRHAIENFIAPVID